MRVVGETYRIDLADYDENLVEFLKKNLSESLLDVLKESFVLESDNPNDDEIDFIHEVSIDAISICFIEKMTEISMKNCQSIEGDQILIEGVLNEIRTKFHEAIKLKRSEIN